MRSTSARRSRGILTALIVAAASIAPLTVADVASAPAASAAGVTISGTGSSYAAIAINTWVSQMFTTYGTSINYQSSSSVQGLENFANGLVDFGASEIGYSTGQAQSTPPASEHYQYLPDIAGATCIMYNVLGSTGQPITELRVNSSILAGIFTGKILKWNDPQITALNPGVLLPNTPLIVTYRADPAGENYIFSDYLKTLEPGTWGAFSSAMGYPNAPTAIWPTPTTGGTSAGGFNEGNWVAQNGSDNASNYVSSSLNTMTYVEAGYALEHNIPCAYVENASGSFVRPSELADAIALTNDQLQANLEQDLTGVYNAPQPGAYPISAYSYLVTGSDGLNPAKGAALSQFVVFLACQGQQAAGTLGYSPLPNNLVQADFDAVNRMAGHIATPPLDAAHCPNPYITGQLQSVGEPPILGQPGGGYTGGAAAGAGAGSGAGLANSAASKTGTGGGPAVLKGIKAGKGGLAAAGQTPGVALSTASAYLLGLSGPTWSMIGWTLAFIALLALPPLGLVLIRRRRLRPETVEVDQ